MDNIYSKDQNQMINVKDSLLPDMQNNVSNNVNENFSNKNNKDNNEKKYDLWQKIKIITYLLFFYTIFYSILIFIFLALKDEKAILSCLLFIIFLGVYDIFYIMLSFPIFCSEDKFSNFDFYHACIFVFVPLIFMVSLLSFLDNNHFTITFQVFAISGSSLMLLLSIIFVVWTCKFIHCNKHVKVEYIFV